MRSFLGVPIVAPEGVIGAFYLTDKEGAAAFGDDDQELIELLAAHAAIAITNARLYERSRELSIVAERNRLALELHDAVSQKLFSARARPPRRPARCSTATPTAARAQVARLQALAREALDELRSLILELRPPDLERDGLARRAAQARRRAARGCTASRSTLEVDDAAGRRRATATARCCGSPRRRCRTRVRHAARGAHRRAARARRRRLVLEVADDGAGFDPGRPGAARRAASG